MTFLPPRRPARLTAVALFSFASLTACSSGSEDSGEPVDTTRPQAAETTTPSSTVHPSESSQPWTSGEATPTTERPGEAPVAPAPGVTADPAEQTAPVAGCSTQTIAADTGEQDSREQMVLGYCDGHWANVSLQSAGLDSWAVNEGGRWRWIESDGYTTNLGAAEDCYLPETLQAHAPVPQEARDALRVCTGDDVLYAG